MAVLQLRIHFVGINLKWKSESADESATTPLPTVVSPGSSRCRFRSCRDHLLAVSRGEWHRSRVSGLLGAIPERLLCGLGSGPPRFDKYDPGAKPGPKHRASLLELDQGQRRPGIVPGLPREIPEWRVSKLGRDPPAADAPSGMRLSPGS